MANIYDNIVKVKERISKAALRSGRDPQEITLIAVTKGVNVDKIKSAIDYGLKNFGENYWQEARNKIAVLNKDLHWHFIGHLQKNKVNSVVEAFDFVQSVDSLELLRRINKRAADLSKRQEVLLQINIVAEEQKFGVSSDKVISILEKSVDFENVLVSGLMLIPPFLDDTESNRMNFKRLKELSLKIDQYKFCHWQNKYLSMGMTDDFEIAIEEGSNMVRIGRAIFGEKIEK